jgi:hypothetical protein
MPKWHPEEADVVPDHKVSDFDATAPFILETIARGTCSPA